MKVLITTPGTTTESTGVKWLDRIQFTLTENYNNNSGTNVRQACENEVLAASRFKKMAKFARWVSNVLSYTYLILVFLVLGTLWHVTRDGSDIHGQTLETVGWAVLGIIAFILLLHLLHRHLDDKKHEEREEMKQNRSIRQQFQGVLANLGAFTVDFLMGDSLYWRKEGFFMDDDIMKNVESMKREEARVRALLALLQKHPELTDEDLQKELRGKIEYWDDRLKAASSELLLLGLEDTTHGEFFLNDPVIPPTVPATDPPEEPTTA